MKPFITAVSFLITLNLFFSCKKSETPNAPLPPTTDSFTVSVTNGHGPEQYKTGDTVHIFTSHYTDNQIFDKWSGDVLLLNAPNEWHTWFIMPNKNVSVTGSIKNSVTFTLKYEQIMGKDRLKPVYSYFPAGHKGIVYLLHGTQGNAAALVNGNEYKILIKDIVNDNFAVIVTEAEESTTGVDANGDGKIRWSLIPADTITNVDYANIRIITDTFYNRGVTDRSKPRYSVGMSNGGFFSSALSSIYKYKAGVNYCSQSSSNLMQTTTIPTQFCMMQNDDNSEVGPAGNAAALSYSNAMNTRGVCSKYFLNVRSPIYTERFARNGTISASQSVAIFNELKSKGYIDSKSYFIGYSDAFLAAFQANKPSFPVINSLTLSQQQVVLEQINLSVTDHHMYSDFNRATLKFLNTQCQ